MDGQALCTAVHPKCRSSDIHLRPHPAALCEPLSGGWLEELYNHQQLRSCTIQRFKTTVGRFSYDMSGSGKSAAQTRRAAARSVRAAAQTRNAAARNA